MSVTEFRIPRHRCLTEMEIEDYVFGHVGTRHADEVQSHLLDCVVCADRAQCEAELRRAYRTRVAAEEGDGGREVRRAREPEASLLVEGRPPRTGIVLNVMEAGVVVMFTEGLAVGEKCELSIGAFSCGAVVRDCRQMPGGCRVALEFCGGL